MQWYLTCFKKYITFKGRARRKEYWMFTLFNIIFSIIAVLADNMIGITFSGEVYGPIYLIYGLAIILPSWTVSVRRLHDIGKSGWWLLITLIPLIGEIIFFIWTVSDSEFGDNKYGANPKGEGPTTDYSDFDMD